MLLAIDVGNTNVALGLYDDGPRPPADPRTTLVRDWRMRTEPRMTSDELALAMRGLLGDYVDQVTGSLRFPRCRRCCGNCG